MQNLREHIAYATQIVNSWPEWKRNALRNSGMPHSPTPRKPVDNFTDSDNTVATSSSPDDSTWVELGKLEVGDTVIIPKYIAHYRITRITEFYVDLDCEETSDVMRLRSYVKANLVSIPGERAILQNKKIHDLSVENKAMKKELEISKVKLTPPEYERLSARASDLATENEKLKAKLAAVASIVAIQG